MIYVKRSRTKVLLKIHPSPFYLIVLIWILKLCSYNNCILVTFSKYSVIILRPISVSLNALSWSPHKIRQFNQIFYYSGTINQYPYLNLEPIPRDYTLNHCNYVVHTKSLWKRQESGILDWLVGIKFSTKLPRHKALDFPIWILWLQEVRGEVTDISASPGRQVPVNQLRPKEPPPMVIQGDFRKVMTLSLDLLIHTLTSIRRHTYVYMCVCYSVSFLESQTYGSKDALRIRTLVPTCRHLPCSISKRCWGTRDHFTCTIRPHCRYFYLLIILNTLILQFLSIQYSIFRQDF